jgi:hypothetical protein
MAFDSCSLWGQSFLPRVAAMPASEEGSGADDAGGNIFPLFCNRITVSPDFGRFLAERVGNSANICRYFSSASRSE